MSETQAVWWAVTIDCVDPEAVARFWSALLRVPVTEPGPDRPGWLRVQPRPDGPFLNFQPVSEPAAGKVRIHLDVLVDDLAAGVAWVESLGGTATGRREELPRGRIAVMHDPEGHEFCLLAPPR